MLLVLSAFFPPWSWIWKGISVILTYLRGHSVVTNIKNICRRFSQMRCYRPISRVYYVKQLLIVKILLFTIVKLEQINDVVVFKEDVSTIFENLICKISNPHLQRSHFEVIYE